MLKTNKKRKRPTPEKIRISAFIHSSVYASLRSVYEISVFVGDKPVEQRLYTIPFFRFTLIARTTLVDVLIILTVVEEHFIQGWGTKR